MWLILTITLLYEKPKLTIPTNFSIMDTKPRILVIEDEPLVLKALNDALFEKYEVLSAMDGKTGLKLIQKELPHLILLDLMLPKMHGFDVLKEAQAHAITAEIPVVILSNLDSKEDIKKGYDLGAKHYMVKSEVDLVIIRNTIAKTLKEVGFKVT